MKHKAKTAHIIEIVVKTLHLLSERTCEKVIKCRLSLAVIVWAAGKFYVLSIHYY